MVPAGDCLAVSECAAEVDGHRRARAALRDSRPIRIPSTLLGLLSQIPDGPPDDEAGHGENGPWRSPRTQRGRDHLADGNPPDRREPR